MTPPVPLPEADMPSWAVRLEGKIDAYVAVSNERTKTLEQTDQRIEAKTIDLDTRLRAVERKVWMAAGFAAAVGGGLGGGLSALLGGSH